jgi:hypothetical protein
MEQDKREEWGYKKEREDQNKTKTQQGKHLILLALGPACRACGGVIRALKGLGSHASMTLTAELPHVFPPGLVLHTACGFPWQKFRAPNI